MARRAIARGRPAEAEALAKQRPATDGAAAGVLGQLAATRGRYDEAIALLEPAVAREPASEAALQLGLIELQLGRTQQATRHLTDVLQQGASGRDVEGLFRGARAAQALGRPRDANSLFKAADAASADPAIDTAWGLLFLEKYNKPEALRSLQDALKLDPEWAPALAGLARVLADENPPAAAAAARKALEIDQDLADAHLLLAELDLDNSKHDDARAEDSGGARASTRRISKRARGWRRSPTCATTRPGSTRK